jgi:hypothetical protein
MSSSLTHDWVQEGAHEEVARTSEGAMTDLYNAATDQFIGSISDGDLQVLIDTLEEEPWRIRTTSSTRRRSTSSVGSAPPMSVTRKSRSELP